MVAKISVGSSLFGALAYNQNKIDEGEGRILCSNKMVEREDGRFDIHSCMEDFNRQLPKDIKTEKPILHISLNPHPDDVLTDSQLTAIAEEYMQKMGYGNQPYMVYKHEDIERHHIHIVSLRVDETGKKIDDSNNFYKSKNITRELEDKYGLHTAEKKKQTQVFDFKKVNADNGNIKTQIANVIKPLAARYRFQSFNEYRALLSLYNVNVEEVKGEVRGRAYCGLVYSATDAKGNKIGNPLKSSLFGKSVGYNVINEKLENSKNELKDKRLREQTRQRICGALRNSPDRKSFEKELSQQGIDVLFRENDSKRIYGVTFIDHNNSCVFNGSRLGKEFSANTFEERFNNPVPSKDIPADAVALQEGSLQEYFHDDGLLDGAFDLFSMENHGTDPEEEQFRRRMQKKKRKGRKM